MLKSIFYARFHQEKGSTVLHQVPEGSIIPCPPSPTAQTPLFDYKSIANYIIPSREFCDRLVSIVVSKYRIIGFPVCIHDGARYTRNEFIFNLCVVLDEEAESWCAYASVVRKLARLFRNLEEQGQFLSQEEEYDGNLVFAGEEGYGGGSKVYALCEMILEDLNSYCECMIPIDESNTVNLKLFPTRPAPPPIHSWHVPIALVRFASLQTHSWDLTVQRLLPFINGINSVVRISTISDTDLSLTRRALAHLLYYGCILLLDIFQFSAVYAPTAEIGVFVRSEKMQDECRAYVASPYSPFGKPFGSLSNGNMKGETQAGNTNPSTTMFDTSTTARPGGINNAIGGSRLNPAKSDIPTTVTRPPRVTILDLYTSLRQGQSLREWCIQHSSQLAGIDVRRLITFGVIKGFLYRVHKYAIGLKPADMAVDLDDPIANARMHEKAWRKAAMSSGWRTPLPALGNTTATVGGDNGDAVGITRNNVDGVGKGVAASVEVGNDAMENASLVRYLDGLHCLDEICGAVGISEREAVKRLRGVGDVAFVHR